MSSTRASIVAKLTRLYPFQSGATRVAHHRLVRTLSGDPDGEAWVKVQGGDLLVSLDDFVGRSAFFMGDLDPKISALVDLCVLPGDVVLDIGANVGIITLRLAARVGPRGVVHAFEPNPTVLSQLRASLKRNGIENVRLHEFALGSETASLQLNVPGGNVGAATFTARFAQTSDKRTVDVPVKVLDDLDLDLRAVSFLKIDVEGFESRVFEGARRFLSETPPDVIVFERNELDKQGAPDNTALLTLKEIGFAIFAIEKSLMSLRLTPYSDEVGRNTAYHDFVAVASTARGRAPLSRLQRHKAIYASERRRLPGSS